MGLLIDTDLLIDQERSEDRATALDDLLAGEDCAISVISMSELLHGALRATGARRVRRRAFVEHLLGGLQAIPITQGVARVHAEAWAALQARGELIGAHDLWIAATALAHGLGVATRNAGEFSRVDGLRVVSPG